MSRRSTVRIASACGVAAAAAAATAALDSAAATAPPVTARIAVSPATPRACGRVAWRFTVVNSGRALAVLHFRDGQRADVTLSRRGRVLYRWSDGKAFTQALWSRPLRGGATWRFALDDVLRLGGGRYTLVARVTGRARGAPARLAVRRALTVRRGAITC